jgi:hypothetical protein
MKNLVWFIIVFSGLHSICLAQVPVSKEPRHHNILENGHIRLLDVHIPPGDTSLIHIHATPSVFVFLTNDVKVGSQVISEEKPIKLNTPEDDNILFEGFYRQPRIHRVWNSDTTEFHVMDIELTNKNYISIDSPIHQQPFTFLFEEKPVRGYRLSMSSVVIISLPARKADVLVIRISDSKFDVQINEKYLHKKGDFIYIPSGNKVVIQNGGKGKDQFAFFELK